MRLHGRKLHAFGVHADVEVEGFSSGDGEAGVAGYYESDGRRIVVDTSHQDDSTLVHEIGHFIADGCGVYLSEHQMVVFEALLWICRDPRNRWLTDYLRGTPCKNPKK